MNNILKYVDETDKSLGVAGMAISLVACDCEEMISSVSLENNDDPLEMTGEYVFTGNPRLSAKVVWQELLKQYQITVGLILGNVLCRNLCAGHSLGNKMAEAVHEIVLAEGLEQCSLEKDEIEALYNKNYRYYTNLFSHPSVIAVAKDFATTLRMQRKMSAGEVIDNLRRLSAL